METSSRIRLGTGIIAKGRYEKRESFKDVENPDLRELIVLGHIQKSYGKALSNCSSETARVQRTVQRAIAGYEVVRRERELVETSTRNLAMESIIGKAGDPSQNTPQLGPFTRFRSSLLAWPSAMPWAAAICTFLTGLGSLPP